MDEELRVVIRERIEEIHLLGDLGQDLGALLQKGGEYAALYANQFAGIAT